MEALVCAVVGVGLVVGLVTVALIRGSTSKWSGIWTEVGAAHGLSYTPDPWRGAAAGDLEGEVAGRRVVVISRTKRNEGHRVTAVVGYTAPGGLVISLDREGAISRLEKLLGARELEVGEAAFDRAFYLHSNHPARAFATLTADVQRLLLEARPASVEVAEGQVRVTFRGFGWGGGPAQTSLRVVAAIDAAVALAEQLEANPDLSGQAPLPATHRPLVARAVGPLLGLSVLAALLVGGPLLQTWQRARHDARMAEIDLEFRRKMFALELLSVAQARGDLRSGLYAAPPVPEILLDDPSPKVRELLAKQARWSEAFQAEREEDVKTRLAALRREWLGLARTAEDPAAEEHALRAVVAAERDDFPGRVDAQVLRETLDEIFAPE